MTGHPWDEAVVAGVFLAGSPVVPDVWTGLVIGSVFALLLSLLLISPWG